MKTTPYWIEQSHPGRLAILPRPRGGDWLDEEASAWRQAGLDIVVSLLTDEEISEFELEREAEVAARHGLSVRSFPIADRGVPESRKTALAFAKSLDEELRAGKHVGIHCRQGLGRSALIAACLLILADEAPDTALRRITAARGVAVPETTEQQNWVVETARERTLAAGTRS